MRMYSPCFSAFYHKATSLSSQWILLFFMCALSACSINKMIPSSQKIEGGVVVHDKTISASGQKMLENGGNAADAMGAMLMTGAVVLPSRMGLGAGGICQVLDPAEGRVKTLDFLMRPMSFDKKIATPALARGVYTLQNKYGRKRWKEIIAPSIDTAVNGIRVSERLSKDILMTPGLDSNWKKLKKGDVFKQPELANTLKVLSSYGAGVLYSGELSTAIVGQSDQIVKEDLRSFKASFMDSIDVSTSSGKTFFPNPSVLSSDGYMIWRAAQSMQETRQQEALLNMEKLNDRFVLVDERVQGVSLIAADKSGLVIACTVSMGRPFGNGQLLQQGFYLGSVIDKAAQGVVFANLFQTNPDVTDVTEVLVSVGDYALVDGLNQWSVRQKDESLLDVTLSDERNENIDEQVSLSCEKGYPNQPKLCDERSELRWVVQKNN